MQLVKEGTRWVAKTKFEERHLPKEAGFRWDPQKRIWWTDKIDRALRLREFATGDVKNELVAVAEQQAVSADLSRAADLDIDIPAPEGLEYLPYQKAGIAYGAQRPNTLIADEMGLGKTIQAIGIINTDPTIKSVLVICPASLKINWSRELRKWLVRPYSIQIVGSNSTFPETNIVIINYEHLGKHREAIRSRAWDVLIVDEAHYIKNSNAQRTQEIIGKWSREKNTWAIAPIEAQRKIMITGTPIENRPVEIWNILRFLDRKRWNNFMEFARRYCNAHHNGWGWDFKGANPETLPELQEILRRTIMVRRLKKDVLKELPPKRRQVIEIPANGMAKVVKAENDAFRKIEDKIAAIRARIELMKACETDEDYRNEVRKLTNDLQASFSELSKLRHETAVAKIPYVVDHVKALLESVEKVIVFAHHHDVADALAKEFGKEAVKVTGNENITTRQAAVDRFQQDATCRVFVGTIGAAGVGLTLTAASVVVFAELDWVPGRVTQAEDRAHRYGQKDSVLIHHLVIDGSIDAKMAHLIVEKQKIIEKALDKNDPEAFELLNTPVLPISNDLNATESVRRKEIVEEAEKITKEQIEAVHEALKMLANYDLDRARELNGFGFNRLDTTIGHELASLPELTAKQAILGRKIIRKYHRQLGWDVLERTGIERKKERA